MQHQIFNQSELVEFEQVFGPSIPLTRPSIVGVKDINLVMSEQGFSCENVLVFFSQEEEPLLIKLEFLKVSPYARVMIGLTRRHSSVWSRLFAKNYHVIAMQGSVRVEAAGWSPGHAVRSATKEFRRIEQQKKRPFR